MIKWSLISLILEKQDANCVQEFVNGDVQKESGGKERGELPEKLYTNLRLSSSRIFLRRALYIQDRRTELF
jgi:hypothetical protein